MAASVHSTDDHKYWWRTIGDPWDASWIRSRTRERKNNQITNCVFFLLFATVRWVAGSETSIIPLHLLSLYPLPGSWAGGWQWSLTAKTQHNQSFTLTVREANCPPFVNYQKKKKSLWAVGGSQKRTHEKMRRKYKLYPKKTQDLLAVRCEYCTMVSPNHIGVVYLLKVGPETAFCSRFITFTRTCPNLPHLQM